MTSHYKYNNTYYDRHRNIIGIYVLYTKQWSTKLKINRFFATLFSLSTLGGRYLLKIPTLVFNKRIISVAFWAPTGDIIYYHQIHKSISKHIDRLLKVIFVLFNNLQKYTIIQCFMFM